MTPWLVNEKKFLKGHLFPGELSAAGVILIEDVCLTEVNCGIFFTSQGI